jgi:hypothetical protein
MNKIKILLAVGFVFCGALFANIILAQTFMGPTCAVGNCQGKIGVDSSGNISIGTSSPQSATRSLIVGGTNDSSAYALRILSSNSSPLLLVRNDGKISIATTSANYALNVAGDIYLSGNLVMSGSVSSAVAAGNVTPGVFNSLQGGGTGAYAFLGSLGVATTTQVGLPQTLSVYGGGYFSGNVGIGTTGPGQKLHVAGVARVDGDLILGDSDNVQYLVANTGTTQLNFAMVGGGNVPLIQFFGTNSYFNGNVGIGTTTPNRILHIRTSSNWGSNIATIQITDSASIGSGITLDATGTSGRRYTIFSSASGAGAGAGKFVIYDTTAGTTRLVVDSSGKVGIGTTTPAYTLDVNGTIRSLSGGFMFPDGTIQTTAASGGVKPYIQVFTSSGTWTLPTGVNMVWVTICGGGGGGGGASSSGNGGGGGGGAQCFYRYPVAVSGNVSVTVGSGGVGGAVDNSGGNGGNSSFGSLIATGGNGGQPNGVGGSSGGGLPGGAPAGGTSPAPNPPDSLGNGIGCAGGSGGGGGSGSSGAVSARGGHSGTYAGGAGGIYLDGGGGGASMLGKGGNGGYASAGQNGSGYGSGGGGGSRRSGTAYGGGNGSPGVVIVEWWQ